MPHLTVVTNGVSNDPETGASNGVQVMQYLGGSRWQDVTFDLQRVDNDGSLVPEDEIMNYGATAIAYMDQTLIVSTFNGARYLDKQEKQWKVPPWETGFDFDFSRFHEFDGKFFVAGNRLIRLSSLLGEPEVEETEGGMSTVSSVITYLSGGPELVISSSGNDRFSSYALPSLQWTFTDAPSGSCGYDMYEYQGVVHSANEYGWTYRSTDGRFYGQHDDDMSIPIGSSSPHKLWSLWEVSGELYAGTCTDGGVGSTCKIVRYDGTLWSTSPTVVEVPTLVYGQGFVRGIQDPVDPAKSYVTTGIGVYDGGGEPDESKCYIFDGTALTDISPPATLDDKPLVRFGAGVQAMCFAPNLVRGKTKIGKAAQRILVSSQTGLSVKADTPVAMTSARRQPLVVAVTIGAPGGQLMSNGNWLQVQSTAGFPPSGTIRVPAQAASEYGPGFGAQVGTYSSLLPAGPGLFPRFVNVQGISGLIWAGSIVQLIT